MIKIVWILDGGVPKILAAGDLSGTWEEGQELLEVSEPAYVPGVVMSDKTMPASDDEYLEYLKNKYLG